MDLGRYRELLGRFHDVVLASGVQTAKASGKWVAEFDQDLAAKRDDQRLTVHLAQVRRSAKAIAILAGASTPNDTLALSESLTQNAASALLDEVRRIKKTLEQSRRVLKDRGIQGLAEQVLSSVTFVMDYGQFDFNGLSLTTFIWPVWSRGSDTVQEGDPGYRDAVCRLIGVQVASVIEDAGSLTLHFQNGVTLKVSLRAEEANAKSETCLPASIQEQPSKGEQRFATAAVQPEALGFLPGARQLKGCSHSCPLLHQI